MERLEAGRAPGGGVRRSVRRAARPRLTHAALVALAIDKGRQCDVLEFVVGGQVNEALGDAMPLVLVPAAKGLLTLAKGHADFGVQVPERVFALVGPRGETMRAHVTIDAQ